MLMLKPSDPHSGDIIRVLSICRLAPGGLSGRRGYSLLELMVVLGIMAITAAIAFSLNDGYRARSAAMDARANLMRARSLAIKENTRVRITFNTHNYSIDMLDKTTGTFSKRIDTITVGNLSITWPNNDNTITFTALGSVDNARPACTISDGKGRRWEVHTKPAGRIWIERRS